MAFTFESFLELLMTMMIVVFNILILMVLFKTEQLSYVNKYFFTSLTLTDLFIGVLITPFSFWTSMFDRWLYGDIFCHVEAYLAAIFWIASIYSLAWMGIDHYVAIRKPERYESLMTKMRCICWVVLIWVAALSFCLPPLFGKSNARYYPEAYLCIVDWNFQKAYIITAGVLIVFPAFIALALSNLYVFTESYRQKKVVYEKCTESNSRPEMYFINFLLGLFFIISWMPWCLLQLHELLDTGLPKGPPAMHFCFMWFAIANSIWKFIIYTVFLHDFRIGLKIIYSKHICNRWN